MGTIKVELYPAKAPITTRNFLDYVNSGFYNGTIVHRVDFVIGLGGYTETMMPSSTRPPIKNESKNGLKNLRGTLAMARFDNPDSATSQFFINLKDNSHLDPSGAGFGYAVFGKVIEGMDVVDKISYAYLVDSASPNILRLRSFAPRICSYSVEFRPVPRPRRV